MRNVDFDTFDPILEQFNCFVSTLDNEDRYDWIRAAGKANQLWGGGREGLMVFDDWSSSAINYNGFEDCAYHYNSLSKNKANGVSQNIIKNPSLLDDPGYVGFASKMHIYSISSEAKESHPYLRSHRVKPHGIRQYGEILLIPMYNLNRKLCAFQEIDIEGRKYFGKGSKIKNLFFQVGDLGGNLIFCEGFATGAAIYQATHLPVIITFNANNLISLPKLFRKRLPRAKFYIAADDDFRPGGSNNVGVNAAHKSVKESNSQMIIPLSKDGKRRKQDFCDVLVRDGLGFLRLILKEQINE